MASNSDQVNVKVRIPHAVYASFIRQMPQQGSVTWFVREVFEQFDRLTRDNPSLAERIRAAFESFDECPPETTHDSK